MYRNVETDQEDARMLDNICKLPKLCYFTHDTDGPSFIIAGEGGYTPLWQEVDVDQLNTMLGVTAPQVKAMVAGSMFGWHLPCADPDSPINRERVVDVGIDVTDERPLDIQGNQ